MMLKRAWIVAVAVSVSTLACSRSEPAPEHEPRPARETTAPAASAEPASRAARPRIVFLGDSLTTGPGLPPDHAVPALIPHRLDAYAYASVVLNDGVSRT